MPHSSERIPNIATKVPQLSFFLKAKLRLVKELSMNAFCHRFFLQPSTIKSSESLLKSEAHIWIVIQ